MFKYTYEKLYILKKRFFEFSQWHKSIDAAKLRRTLLRIFAQKIGSKE
jgi:hypothetical protein